MVTVPVKSNPPLAPLMLTFEETNPLTPIDDPCSGLTITTPLTALISPPHFLLTYAHYILLTGAQTTVYIVSLPQPPHLGSARLFEPDYTAIHQFRREALFDSVIVRLDVHLAFLQSIVDRILPHNPPPFKEALLRGDGEVTQGAIGGLYQFLAALRGPLEKVQDFENYGVQVRTLIKLVEDVLEMEEKERVGALLPEEKWEMYYSGWKKVGDEGKRVVGLAKSVAGEVQVEGMRALDWRDWRVERDQVLEDGAAGGKLGIFDWRGVGESWSAARGQHAMEPVAVSMLRDITN